MENPEQLTGEKFWASGWVGHIKRTRGCAPRPSCLPDRSPCRPSSCSPLSDSSSCFPGLRPAASRAARAHRPCPVTPPAAAAFLFPVLRLAARPCCARPVVLSSSFPALVLFLGLWPLRGLGLAFPAPRGLRLRCAPPASPFRCAVLVPYVTCFSFRCASCFSAGLRPGPGGPSSSLLVHRWCRLRRAVWCPACFSSWFTDRCSLSGAAPLPLLLRRRCFAGVPSSASLS